ncbi:MAG: TonB-dependent receptor [Bacteroidota bacterium]
MQILFSVASQTRSLLAFSLLLILGFAPISAQNLTLQGHVQLENGDPAVGATIVVDAGAFGTQADEKGDYQISGLRKGTHRLKVSYLGTKTYETEFTIEDQDLRLDIDLEILSGELDEVVVYGETAAEEQGNKGIVIESIELKETSLRVRDLNEAIDQLPGVRVRNSGSLGDRTDISLNGLNGTAVRLYIDGLPMEFVYPSLNLGNLPLTNIQRLDVYKGVVPVDVGTDAMGGGVNIIRDFQPFTGVQAYYNIGSFNTHIAGLNANYAIKPKVILNVNASYNYSDNDYEMLAYVWEEREELPVRRFHDQYELLSLDASLAFKDQKWADLFKVGVSYADYYKELQNGGLIGRTAFGEAFYEGNNRNTTLEYRKSLGKSVVFRSTFAISEEQVIFEDTSRVIYSWSGDSIGTNPSGEFSGATLSDRQQLNTINRSTLEFTPGENNRITLSNLYARQRLSGRDIIQPEERDLLTYPQYLTKDVLGLAYTRELLQDRLELSLGGKLYYFGLDGVDPNAFTPLGLNSTTQGWYVVGKYDIIPGFFVRASYERAWRIPTFAQFFGNGNNIRSNILLKPESSDNYNAGVVYRRQNSSGDAGFSIELNGFQRAQNDIIFLTPALIGRYINAEEVISRGIEAEVSVKFLRDFRINANVTRMQKVYESIDSDNPAAQFLIGTPFPNTPTFFGNIRLQYNHQTTGDMLNGFGGYVQFKYVDEFNFINVGQVRNDDNWVPVQYRLDAGLQCLSWKERLTISANVYNVLDAQLFDNFAIPRPGRNYNIRISYQFQKFNQDK